MRSLSWVPSPTQPQRTKCSRSSICYSFSIIIFIKIKIMIILIILIRWFIPRKFAKATNAHLVDSSEEESFQFIFKHVQWRVRWTHLNRQTVPHSRTVDQVTPVAVARPCSWKVKLVQIGGPEVGTAGAVWRRLTACRKVWWCQTVDTLVVDYTQSI